MSLLLPVLLVAGSGYLVVGLGWQRSGPAFADYLLRTVLTVGFGLGIFSVAFFLSLLLNLNPLLLDLVVPGLLLFAFAAFPTRAILSKILAIAKEEAQEPPWLDRVMMATFVLALGAALYSAVLRVRAYPQGDGWDAFSIWNLRARFLFLGGSHWRDGFAPLLPWSHPDYPLLLPGAVAHFWSYLGYDDPHVPAVIGFVFTFGAAGLLFSALSLLRGRMAALLGTTALLATPAFIEQGTSQYADVPLSFFFLATIALLCLHDDRGWNNPPRSFPGLQCLAGFAAACAAWTKNEGQLFLCAVVAARLLLLWREGPQKSWAQRMRPVASFLLVIVPALLLIACFKHFLAPPGDLFSDRTATLHKFVDPARYWAVIQWYFKGFFRFGHWLLIPGSLALLGFYFVNGKAEPGNTRYGIRTSMVALGLTLAGYFAVYLITPYDIYWHLRFSLTRLFLQLWPSVIFLLFLLVKSEMTTRNAGRTKA